MRKLVREAFGGKDFIQEPAQIDNLFRNFNCPYYNFNFFKELQFDVLKDQFVIISVQAEKEAELMEMVSRV